VANVNAVTTNAVQLALKSSDFLMFSMMIVLEVSVANLQYNNFLEISDVTRCTIPPSELLSAALLVRYIHSVP
jgi:hypothetical protein